MCTYFSCLFTHELPNCRVSASHSWKYHEVAPEGWYLQMWLNIVFRGRKTVSWARKEQMPKGDLQATKGGPGWTHKAWFSRREAVHTSMVTVQFGISGFHNLCSHTSDNPQLWCAPIRSKVLITGIIRTVFNTSDLKLCVSHHHHSQDFNSLFFYNVNEHKGEKIITWSFSS